MNQQENTRHRVNAMLYEHPELLETLRACVSIARKSKGTVAAPWVSKELKRRKTKQKLVNLRTLLRFGILEKVPGARKGKRIYYAMTDVEAVRSALQEHKA